MCSFSLIKHLGWSRGLDFLGSPIISAPAGPLGNTIPSLHENNALLRENLPLLSSKFLILLLFGFLV